MKYEVMPDMFERQDTHEWFKQESLGLLREQLKTFHYPGYPAERLTMSKGVIFPNPFGRIYLPNGKWHVPNAEIENVDGDEASMFRSQGYKLDYSSRPLHPWIEDLLAEDIGVVTGKGFYHGWGANRTADPIIVRTDTAEPMVLLVQRNDTSQWALPGGFLESGETGQDAAFREAAEETLIDWSRFDPAIEPVYRGPLADVRFTANAWPETEAFLISLNPRLSAEFNTDRFRGCADEVRGAGWFTAEQAEHGLFGSHKLLVALALQKV